MDFWITVYNFFDRRMTTPTDYSTFHIVCIILCLSAAALLITFFGNASEKFVRRLAAILWITMVVFEIGKQLIYGFDVEDGKLIWDYEWYAFPFQFCSSPLYILPFVAFAKDGKIRDSAMLFLATFSLFAGICVYVIPGDVFVSRIYINVQTMLHHGIQLFFGAYLAYRCRDKLTLKKLPYAAAVFSVLVSIAMVLNLTVHNALRATGHDDSFNMFYISPYYQCHMPILSAIDEVLPSPAFIVVYILGFTICAGMIMYVMSGIFKLPSICKLKLAKPAEIS